MLKSILACLNNFQNTKGNSGTNWSLRLALGACIIQAEYGFSDGETVRMIKEHPYFQYFCGYSGYYDSIPPFDPSLMVYFRKRLTPEILGEINELIIAKAQPQKTEKQKNDDDQDSGNGGTMIVDANSASSIIKYPQDTALLNEAREWTEDIIDALHTPGEAKPHTDRKEVRKDYLSFARCRKRSRAFIRKSIRKQLGYIARILGHIDAMLAGGKVLDKKSALRLEMIQKLFERQKYIYDNNTHCGKPDRQP